MQQAKVRKFTSRLLVVLLTLTMAFDYNIAMAYAASNITLPDNQYLVSQTDNNIAPGIKESQIVSNDKAGNRQNMDYVCEVDLKNTKTTKIIAGYNNYDGSKWGMQTVAEQAKAAAKATGYNIVAAINADFFNMATGAPTGALVMNGKVYHGTNGEPYFAILKDGTAVIRESNVPLDDVQEAVGGSNILVKNGKALDFGGSGAYGTGVNPRTVIGIKPDGKVVTLVNDGRQAPISYGRSFQELADIMESMGCETALNLDGGGSTTFLSKPEGSDKLECRNSPSDGGERSVSSSLFIVSTAKPSGEFDHAAIEPNNLVYTPKSKIPFSAKGVDSAGGQAKLPDDISWALEDSKYGEINSEGVFTSNGTTGEVKVNLMSGGNVVGSTTITIAIPDSITFKNDEVSLGFSKESDLGIIVKYKGRDVKYKDGDFKWTLSDESMGTFNGNIFTSSDSATVNGDATATCVYDKNISGAVHLVIGRLPSVVLDFEDKKDAEGNVTQKAEDYYTFASGVVEPGGGKIVSQEGDGLLLTANYGRGSKHSAEIVDIDSGEPVRFGTHSLKLNYDFSGVANITEGVCVGFTEATKEIKGNPTGIGMWVYAPEGTPNLWLRIRVKNGTGSVSTLNFTESGKYGGINWNGWRYVEASLAGVQGPYSLIAGETIRIMYVPPNSGFYTRGATKDDGSYELIDVPKSECKGSIYIDNLQFVYGANKDDIDNPKVDSITANDEEIKDGMTIDSNTINFKSLFSDVENKYTSGINYDTVRMYIDGVHVPSENNKNYVLEKRDNTVYLYNAKLANGEHSITISVRDNFGNETTETRYFTVKGEQNYTTMNLAPTSDKNPILNHDFDIALTTNNIEDVKSIETGVKINNKFPDFNVKFNDDYEGTSSYNSKSGTINISAKRKDSATSSGNGAIATITFKIPKGLTQGTNFTYSVEKGKVTYNSEKDDGFTSSFSIMQKSLKVDAPLIVKPETMIVGSTGKIYVYDVDGNPVEGSEVLTKDGTSLGTTNKDGYIETDALCKAVEKYTIYAQKGEDISYSVSGQSVNSAGNEDGLPEYVISNATSNATSSKNITWMSNTKKSAAKAIVEIAKKSEYEKNAEKAFEQVEGTSKIQNFLGSTDISKNYSVRINKVLVTGLSSNTQYVYRVGDGTNWSGIKEFKTVRKGTATNFFVIGDTQTSDSENVDKIQQQLSEGNYKFGIQTGDSIENASLYNDWVDVLNVFGSDYLSKIDMVHVLGNHEFMGDSTADAAKNIYNLSNDRHYSVEYGNVYVGVINYTTDKEQLKQDLEWLKSDAKASNAKWKVLTMHQPPYYTNIAGNSELINELVPSAAQEAGIDFVFSGHDHSYARTEPLKDGKVNENDGIVYYISGSTGEKAYQITDNKDFHFAITNGDFKAVYLTVSATDDKFTVTAHDVDGGIIDSYTKTKVKEECKNGHEYVYDGEYLTCKNCGYSKELDDYTGFATDEVTSKKMYFIDGKFKTGWFTYEDDIYYFDSKGLAEELKVIEDVKTTCTTRGYKTVQNSLGQKKTIKSLEKPGHILTSTEYEGIYSCSRCGKEIKDISYLDIMLVSNKTEYTGKQRPQRVMIPGLTQGIDYDVHYFDNIEVGDARVAIAGKGDYIGTVTKTYVIYRKMSTLAAVLESNKYEYDGKEKTPKVTIEGLEENKDYTVSYSNNVNTGTATATIKGIAPYYEGTIIKTFEIGSKD
ncbi:phosphodiester glycosidase family protein, partial [Intestinibacter bartlettii]|uniref:phosphodiester glycosidase family protein n=1 Tax=Intestinibacter bartlettii TaxID=261299 RepID=UPI0006D810FC